MDGVEKEIKIIESELDIKKIDEFFEAKESYSDKHLKDAEISNYELSEYADLILGRKIAKCIKESGSCEFEAEL